MDMLDARLVDGLGLPQPAVAMHAPQHTTLTLRVVRRPDGAAPGYQRFELQDGGLTIGRSPGCDMVLDDPFRMVSRRHAWLAPQDDGLAILRCISTGVDLKVNDQVVPPGGECVVRGGDCLDIGGFVLLLESPGVAPAANAGTLPTLLARRPRLDQWFNLDGVADPLGPESPLPPAPAGLEAAPVHAPRAPLLRPTPDMKPMPAVPPRATAAAADLQRDRQEAALQPPSPSPAVQPAPRPVSAGGPALAPAEPAGEAALQDSLKAALLRGAGLDPGTPLQLDEATMERLGAMLRTSTEGTLELLRSRALAKRSIRAEGTLIAARSNNPLKFTPDAHEALAMLLAPRGLPGFMAPVPALQQAFDDLQIHQLAMLAGMRAALHDMVARLGPQATETDEGPARGLARHVPALHEAALWRRHQAAYVRMQAQLDDVFEATFGREFVKAYEAQARLAAQGAPAQPVPAA